MREAVLVGAGGMLGCIARYWLGGLVQRGVNTDFPLGTISVNLLGGFIIGLVMALSIERNAIGPGTRLLLTTGFCGGFTTMSTFSYETLALLGDGQTTVALSYVGASLVGCVAAVWIGQVVARLL